MKHYVELLELEIDKVSPSQVKNSFFFRLFSNVDTPS